jgi:hypothetical protein
MQTICLFGRNPTSGNHAKRAATRLPWGWLHCCLCCLLGANAGWGGVVWSKATAVAAARQDDQKKTDALPPIPGISIAQAVEILEKVGAANEGLIQLAYEEGVLRTNIPADYQTANNIRNQIGQAIRNYGGHSSVSGNNQYECHLMSPELNGVIQRKDQAEMWLHETKGQKRRIEISDGTAGLRIALSNNEDYYLLFHDRRELGLLVQESDGDFLFNGHFKDFNDFCLRNTDYCQQRLFPLLRRFGVKFPDTAYASNVKDLMLELIADDGQDAQRLVAEVSTLVNAAEFQQRQAGFKRVMAGFAQRRLAIVQLILDQKQTAELRHHLLEGLGEQDKPLQQILKNIVMPQDLLSNVPFLVWTLQTVESPLAASDTREELVEPATDQAAAAGAEQAVEQVEQNAAEENAAQQNAAQENAAEQPLQQPTAEVTAAAARPPDPRLVASLRQRLAELTQQPADLSLEQWHALAFGRGDEQAIVATALQVPPAFFETRDGWNAIEGKLAALLQLASTEQTLRWDREQWRAAFQFRTPRQHFDEARAFIQERSLPSQWLVEPTDYRLDEEVQALVLFERLRPEFKERPANPNHAYYRQQQAQAPSNACRIDGEAVLLSLDLGESPVRIDQAPCRLMLAEHGNQKRVIQLVDRPEGDFSVTLRSEDLGLYLRLQVKSSGATNLRQFQGATTLNVSAESYAEFQAQNPEWEAQVLQPLLRLLGGQVRAAAAELP